jgi:LAO/AO transport system kinase
MSPPSASTSDVAALVDAARDGSPRAVGRLISIVEDASPNSREVLQVLATYPPHAHVVGLTGPPGVGKSTTTSALAAVWRGRGLRVGILAIDPSSPFTDGALLGDRIRMQEHALDPGVYVRSMANRGRLGGLAWSTPQALRILDATGFDVVVIETVGVGQAEVDIASLADTTVVVLAPGLGDGIQAVKAGVLEIADLYVVNKADREGAARTARELRQMTSIVTPRATGDDVGEPWITPVHSIVATRGEGVADLVDDIAAHGSWLASGSEGSRRRLARTAAEIEQIALRRLRIDLAGEGGAALAGLAADVVAGRLDPYAAADRLVENL